MAPLLRHAAYALAAAAFGPVWLAANPIWHSWDRDPLVWIPYLVASALAALLLRRPIRAARGWRLWRLAVAVPFLGHFLVMWGIAAAVALQDGRLGLPSEPLGEALLKQTVVLPALALMLTVPALPVYVPLGALYVWALRAIDRVVGAPRAVAP